MLYARRSLVGAVALALATGLGSADVLSDWKPTRNVELVVPLAPGGGIDVATRSMQRIIQQHKLVPTSTTVMNKPGAGNSLGYVYVSQQKKNPHYIGVVLPTVYGNAAMGRHPLTQRDLTLVNNLYSEHTAVYLREESDIKTIQDLAERLKKDPSSVSFGVNAIGAGHYFALVKFMIALGLKPRDLKTAVFNSTGESTTAVRGGHITAVAGAAAGAVAQAQAGGIRILAISAAEPIKAGPLMGVPTWRSAGYDVVHSIWRGIIAPPGITNDQIRYWEDTFEKLTKTSEWQELLEKNGWSSTFQRSGEFQKFVDEEEAEDIRLFKEVGLIK
jgi:putative tricarboxylic transport membrane protein